MDRYNIFLLIFVLNLCVLVRPDAYENGWIEPNVWNRNVELPDSDDEVCRRCANMMDRSEDKAGDNACTIDGVSLIYYKKFIRNLFNRQKMKQDVDPNVYIRTLTFTVTAEQLENIEKLEDPRDLDIILTDIFGKVKSPYKVTLGGQAFVENPGTVALVLDILKDFLQLLKHSNVQFFLIVVLSILVGWYVHRRFHIGAITLIIGGFLLFGYFVTYLECNEQLEVERMMHAIARNEQTENAEQKGFFSWLFSPKETHSKKAKKSSKLKWAYCRPDEVAIIYANDMMMKNLEILIEKCTDSFVNMKDKFGFPYNIIAGVTLVAMIVYIVKLFFKYILSPRAWGSLLHRPHWGRQEHPLQGATVAGAITEDRISGDNLKLLLNAITKTPAISQSTDSSKHITPAISGVQVILEQIEGTQSSSSSKNNSPNNSREILSNSGNNNCKVKFGFESECDVSIEDLPHEEEKL